MSEGLMLLCDVLPELPAAADTFLRVSPRRVVLVTVDGALGTASVGNKYQILLG